MEMPPLNALRAFEAAARHGGFVAAAAELRVTPAAVSQQVRKLEGWFGRQLFRRMNNRVALTDAGQAAYPEVAEAMGRLGALAARMVEARAARRVVLSVLPSIAAGWLRHRWAALAAAEPEVRIDLRVEDDPVDFAKADLDLRLTWGAGLYPDFAIAVLADSGLIPVCAPGFLAGRPGLRPEGLQDRDLIHDFWGPSYASNPDWGDWFGAAGLARRPDARQGHRAGMSAAALDMAAAGMGIALGPRLLAGPLIEAGALVIPFGPELPAGQSYVAVAAHRKLRRPDVARLRDRLIALV